MLRVADGLCRKRKTAVPAVLKGQGDGKEIQLMRSLKKRAPYLDAVLIQTATECRSYVEVLLLVKEKVDYTMFSIKSTEVRYAASRAPLIQEVGAGKVDILADRLKAEVPGLVSVFTFL